MAVATKSRKRALMIAQQAGRECAFHDRLLPLIGILARQAARDVIADRDIVDGPVTPKEPVR